MMAAHGDILQSYICNKIKWTIPVFLSVDWMGLNGFYLNWIMFDKLMLSSLSTTGSIMDNNRTYSPHNNISQNAQRIVAK